METAERDGDPEPFLMAPTTRAARKWGMMDIAALWISMALYSFIGVAVTSATIVIYGQPIWDPIVLLAKSSDPLVLVISMVALCLATLATNWD